MTSSVIKINPKLDLVLERELDVPVELVWKAWTTPQHLREWFAPKPWTITACDLDLRPGGAINFTMRSPDGDEYPNTQCYLEVKPFERLIITDTLLGGYRPSANPFFTAVLEFAKNGNGLATRLSPSMATMPRGRNMRKWDSTTAGARWSARWWITSRQGICSSD